MSTSPEHDRWMRRCIELARQGAGRVSPNPMVGAVLVSPEGEVLGEGWHTAFGAPHAEVEAIARAGASHSDDEISRARLYVNLEPCSHHGKTPPCSDHILRSGIRKVVAGMLDPFRQVSGRGIRRLKGGGVEVIAGVLGAECFRLNEAFVRHVTSGLPLVTVKQACTADGRVATASGDSRWISGLASRALVHRWRAEMDAVLVGSRTARMDNPRLTVRHVVGRQPLRVVLDREADLPSALNLFSDDQAHRTVALVQEGLTPPYASQLQEAGGRVLGCPLRGDKLDLRSVLRILGRELLNEGRPVQSVLVEAGPGLASALWEHDLCDRYCLFISPRVLGGGEPTLRTGHAAVMSEATRFDSHEWEQVGDDMLLTGFRRPVPDLSTMLPMEEARPSP
jgi:diaminohydroxyphosphoribosylaminopyrimidine deaminase / 5-amino-6-(5-phosphoribosylamino)uracil reductase